MTIRAVIFDVDETLVPERDAWAAAFRVACRDLAEQHRCNVDELYNHVWSAAREIWRASPHIEWCDAMGMGFSTMFLSDYPGDSPVLAYMRENALGFQRDAWRTGLAAAGIQGHNDIGALGKAFREGFRDGHVAYDDAEPVLQALSGLPMAALTNGAPDVQRGKLTTSGLDRYFQHIFVSGEHGIGKPDARIFHLVLDALGVSPLDAVMVGDSVARDIAGAHNAGIRAVWLDRHGAGEAPSLPHHRIESLLELPGLLKTL